MEAIRIDPRGPFSLAAERDFAGGFPAGIGGGDATGHDLVMVLPVERGAASGPSPSGPDRATDRWRDSAWVRVSQAVTDDPVRFEVGGTSDPAAALAQAVRSLSLDHDGSGWPDVGRRDPVIARLQLAHAMLRPVCFYSAYEAATSFVIGQRIARTQAARIKARLGEVAGDRLTVDGRVFAAFPRPDRLLAVDELPGLSAEKIARLHGLAEAALDGRLATEALRAAAPTDALATLRALRGVGDFTAQGILLRGCGLVDELPADALSDEVLGTMYPGSAPADVAAITDAWRPYRTWATFLLRVGWTRAMGSGASYRRDRPVRPDRPARSTPND